MLRLGEGIGGGGEDRERVDAGRLGALQAAHVGDEDRVADAGSPVERREQRLGIRQLGDRPRRHEAGRLDLAQAGVGEEADERGLGLGRDDARIRSAARRAGPTS